MVLPPMLDEDIKQWLTTNANIHADKLNAIYVPMLGLVMEWPGIAVNDKSDEERQNEIRRHTQDGKGSACKADDAGIRAPLSPLNILVMAAFPKRREHNWMMWVRVPSRIHS